MPAVRAQVISTAASHIGYREKKSNITEFWARQKPAFQGQPWCAAFVVDVLERLGNTELEGATHPYYVPSLEAWAKKNRRWINSRDAHPGDVLVFGTTIGVHTGFLERQRGDHVQTIEGNTSSGSGGSQNDGGGVYRRVRPRSWVRGAIRMDLAAGSVPVPAVPVDGRFNRATVEAAQRLFNRDRRRVSYWPRLVVDGEWGPLTSRAFQAWLGFGRDGVDGEIGPRTVARADARFGTKSGGRFGRTIVRALQRYLNAELKGKRL